MINSIPIRILILSQLIILFVSIQPAFAQDKVMIAYYGKMYSNMAIDSTKGDENIIANFRELEKKLALRMPEVEYQLIFTKTESLFTSVARLSQGDDQLLDLAIIWADGDGIRSTNLQTNEKLFQKETFGKMFLISMNTGEQKWDLLNETKKIGQFNCFKATTKHITRNPAGTFKKSVIAWYTTDLPFPHGPIGYGGLPGLIVELNYENASYFLKKLDLSPKEAYKIEKPIKSKKVTINEYDEWGIEASKNISFGN